MDMIYNQMLKFKDFKFNKLSMAQRYERYQTLKSLFFFIHPTWGSNLKYYYYIGYSIFSVIKITLIIQAHMSPEFSAI